MKLEHPPVPPRVVITIREISNGFLVSKDSDHTYFETYEGAVASLTPAAASSKRKSK